MTEPTNERPATIDWQQQKADGWASRFSQLMTATMVFLSLTGLSIFLLPFSVLNQHAVLTHTVAGLLMTVPFFWFMAKHIKIWWKYPLTPTKFTGWAAGILGLVCMVSGLVLTWEGVFATRITYLWRTVHIITTFGTLFFFVPHLVAILLREQKRMPLTDAAAILSAGRKHLAVAGFGTGAGLVATVALVLMVPAANFVNEFPADYDEDPYGRGPFAPSLANTSTGGAFDSASLDGSASCGTAGCHQEIYEEWLPSAHRYAAMDAGFQVIQGVMAEQNGPVSTRYCAGCHDPISLFSGTKFIGVEDLTSLTGYQEGISCLSCHAIEQTDIKGNANYVMSQPERYVWETREGPMAKFLGDFLIRTYPQKHLDTLSRRMFKTPEFCAACHKQFIDEEVNQVGWVQLQNQFDNWKSSKWNHPGEPDKTLECRECHMPLQDSADPASGDAADYNRNEGDGKHRSHRFLGANQFVAKIHELPGAEEHCDLVEDWLKGEYPIPELEGRWSEGPVVPLEIDAPAEVVAGTTIPLRVHVLNNKAGHDFPTGPLDIIQAWVEIVVTDDAGNVVFHSGKVDENNFVEQGSFMFKAEPVDRYGNLIDRHNLWEMVGVRFKRSMFPGASDMASYDFLCPPAGAPLEKSEGLKEERVDLGVPVGTSGTLHIAAKLNYRKFDQYLLNFAFGEDSGLTAPITVLSEAQSTIKVLPAPPSD